MERREEGRKENKLKSRKKFYSTERRSDEGCRNQRRKQVKVQPGVEGREMWGVTA